MMRKKSGAGANSSRKCIYYEQMLFLKKVALHKDTVSSLSENIDETNEATDECTERGISEKNICSQIESSEFSRPAARKGKNRQPDELEARMLEILEKTDTSKPNRHLSFFQGILPLLQNLNDDQTIEFQLGVLNVIKNVKKHRPSFPPTQNFPSHQPIYNMPGFSGCSSTHPTASSYPQAIPNG
jgi:hypothetical protein